MSTLDCTSILMPLDIAILDTEEPAVLSWQLSWTLQVLEFVNNTDNNYVAVSQYQTGPRCTGETLDICLLNKDLGEYDHSYHLFLACICERVTFLLSGVGNPV